MMKELAEILIEGIRYRFDPETEYMKDGQAYCKTCHERKDGEVKSLMDMKFIFKNNCKCDRSSFQIRLWNPPGAVLMSAKTQKTAGKLPRWSFRSAVLRSGGNPVV